MKVTYVATLALLFPAIQVLGAPKAISNHADSGRINLTASATDATMKEIPDDARILFMLSAENISVKGFEEFTRLQQLRFLRLNDTVAGDAALLALSDHPSLERLMMWSDGGITSASLEALSTVKSLSSLEFSGVELRAAELRSVPAQLNHLAISNCDIRDSDLKALPTFPHLKSIRIQLTDKITDAGLIKSIKRHPDLESVWVDIASDRFLNALTPLANLKTLRVQGESLSLKGWQTIGRLKTLEEMSLSSDPSDEALAQIRSLSNPRMKHLSHQGKFIYLHRSTPKALTHATVVLSVQDRTLPTNRRTARCQNERVSISQCDDNSTSGNGRI